MMILKILILCAVALFWGSILWALHRRGGFWAEWPISSELSGRFSNPVDIAFIVTGFALAASPVAFGYGIRSGWAFVPDLILFAAGASTIGTMLSRRVWPNEAFHLVFAGIAFAGAGIGFAAIGGVLGNMWMLGLALASILPAGVTLLANMKPLHEWLAKFSRVEWLTAALLMGWLIAATIVF